MRILFITATRVGDAVLTTGLLSYLVGRFPGARITIAAGADAAPLFEPVPGLERLIVVTKERFGLHWLRLWRQCIGQRWDMVVDLRRSAIGWLLFAKKRRIAPKATGGLHRVEALAATLGLQDAPPTPHIWVDAAHAAAAADILPDDGPVLALAPAANWPGKQWQPERFTELAARLTGPNGILPNARVAVFAAANERAAIEPVLSGIPADRLIDTVGRIDLPTVAACLRRCTFFVGNDSGLMHLAAACDIPVLGLFGPSREEHYAPWGERCGWVRTRESYDELIAAPGYDHRTTGTVMDGLSVGRAEEAARALWRRLETTAP
jgi:lipopolysaccharide heptosyltransferase III